jgi:hypothetical protein
MPCEDVPKLVAPSISPLSLGVPSLPPAPKKIGLAGLVPCCDISIPLPSLPYPLGNFPPLPPLIAGATGIETVLNAALSDVSTFLSSLVPPCPLNSSP